MIKNCIRCNSEFKTKPSKIDAKYCSIPCRIKARIIIRTMSCKSCKETFEYKLNNSKNITYCSRDCRAFDSRNRINLACTLCNKSFETKAHKTNAKYCSKKCRTDSAIGRPSKLDFWGTASKEKQLLRLKELFEKKVVRKDGCWEWNGNKDEHGYGFLPAFKRTNKAHRISWILHNGEIPKGMFICHHCDNPPCTNPEHLFLGTPKDNSIDCINKGRNNSPKGSRHPHAKLSEIDVIEIRKLLKETNFSFTQIATKFGVSPSAIGGIKYKTTWKHLKD